MTRIVALKQASTYSSFGFIDARLEAIREDLRGMEQALCEARAAVTNAFRKAQAIFNHHPLIRKHKTLRRLIEPEFRVRRGQNCWSIRLPNVPFSPFLYASEWIAYRCVQKHARSLDSVITAALENERRLTAEAKNVAAEVTKLEQLVAAAREGITVEVGVTATGNVTSVRLVRPPQTVVTQTDLISVH
jgi:hypothetical protein